MRFAVVDFAPGTAFWVGEAAIVAVDPTKNKTIDLGVWSTLDKKIADKYPTMFAKWRDMVKDICQHVAGDINNKPPEQTKIHNTRDTKDQN